MKSTLRGVFVLWEGLAAEHRKRTVTLVAVLFCVVVIFCALQQLLA